jgi:hypothetical protein
LNELACRLSYRFSFQKDKFLLLKVPYSKPQGEVGSCPRKKKDGWAFGYYVA